MTEHEALKAIQEFKVQEPETFRDRLKREHPDCVNDEYVGGCNGCPYDYEYEPNYFESCDGVVSERACYACWDRPIPKDVKNC